MTFPESLKELARLMPEKLELHPIGVYGGVECFAFYWGERERNCQSKEQIMFSVNANNSTQCDIDEILALCGRRYIVVPKWDIGTGDANLWVRIYTMDWIELYEVSTSQGEKLLAAQAALIAIVERLAQHAETEKEL